MPVSDNEGFDLMGNTVVVNVVEAIAEWLAAAYVASALLAFKNAQLKFLLDAA